MAHQLSPRVLVGDDQPDVLAALRLLLRGAGFETDTARSVAEIRDRLRRDQYDLLLMDLNYARDTTSGQEGLALVSELHASDPLLPVLVMTGWASIDTAVEAMRRGARGFVNKPWDNLALTANIAREVEDGRALRRADRHATREQQEAQELQRALVPGDLPTVGNCTMAARWMPAATFGGDCYDVVHIDDSRVAFWIADVCGKGLPAAFVMSHLQASVRAFASAHCAPHAVTSTLNAELARRADLRRFVTCFYGLLDVSTQRLAFTNAGHNPPLLIRQDGSVERLTAGGVLLGAFPETSFEEGTVDVAAGDRLLLFTDGITEAWSPDNEGFGEGRLLDVIRSNHPHSGLETVNAIFDEVIGFAAGPPQDDATVFIVCVG